MLLIGKLVSEFIVVSCVERAQSSDDSDMRARVNLANGEPRVVCERCERALPLRVRVPIVRMVSAVRFRYVC